MEDKLAPEKKAPPPTKDKKMKAFLKQNQIVSTEVRERLREHQQFFNTE